MQRLIRSRALRIAFQVVCVGAAGLFIARIMWSNRDQFGSIPWQLNPGLLLVSVIVGLIAALLWSTIWWRMAVRAGSTLPWAQGVRVYLISNLAKYLPGSIWGYVSRAYLGRDAGLTAYTVGVSSIWEVGVTILASLLLATVTLPSYPADLPPAAMPLMIGVTAAAFFLLLPPVTRIWSRWLRFGRFTGAPVQFGWGDFAFFGVAAFLTHILVGSGFYLFAHSIVALPWGAWVTFIGIWSFSATMGLIVAIAPYGMGIKEGILAVLLSSFMPAPAAALVAIASRLWTVGLELLEAGIAAVAIKRPVITHMGD